MKNVHITTLYSSTQQLQWLRNVQTSMHVVIREGWRAGGGREGRREREGERREGLMERGNVREKEREGRRNGGREIRVYTST